MNFNFAAPVVFPRLDRAGVALCRCVMREMLQDSRESQDPKGTTRVLRVAIADPPGNLAAWREFIDDVVSAGESEVDVALLALSDPVPDIAHLVSDSEAFATSFFVLNTDFFFRVLLNDNFKKINSSACVMSAPGTKRAFYECAASKLKAVVAVNADFWEHSGRQSDSVLQSAGLLLAFTHCEEVADELTLETVHVDSESGDVQGDFIETARTPTILVARPPPDKARALRRLEFADAMLGDAGFAC